MRGDIKIVAISDTHLAEPLVPGGDILVHAGDFTNYGTINEVWRFIDWFRTLPHKHKVLVAGNHDDAVQHNPELHDIWFADNGITYLQDQETIIHGLRFYGTPWQPRFTQEPMAFNLERHKETKAHWKALRGLTVDVLVTHGPPLGYGDKAAWKGTQVGCREQLAMLKKAKPKVVVCGHVHGGYGLHVTEFGTLIANAALGGLENKPLIFTMRGEL